MNPGDLISGKYRLQRLLGSGGMGSVWAARNQLTDRDFAIKFLLPSLSSSQEALQRFFHEARACGQIKHPAVVDVYDMGQAEDGSPYLVMELLDGEGLDRRLKQGGAVSPSEAAAWIAFIARGLEEAHVRGLVHRDLKPANLFLCHDPSGDVVPKILDFGISKPTGPKAADFVRTSAGVVLGSPAYMSPEQAKGEVEIDGRSDVWSLGVILYEALTGKLPFKGPNYNALMVSIITNPHPPISAVGPEVPKELAAVVDRALAKDRARRIGTARELAERLEAVLAMLPAPGPSSRRALTLRPGPGGAAARGTTTQQTWAGGRLTAPRSRAGVIGLGALVAAALLAAGGAAFQQLRPAPAPVAARSSMRVTASLARVAGEMAQIRAQSASEQRAEAERKAQQIAGEERAKAEREAQQAAEKVQAPRPSPRTRNPQRDPHGGVDNPGF